jgi:hypothetical protein
MTEIFLEDGSGNMASRTPWDAVYIHAQMERTASNVIRSQARRFLDADIDRSRLNQVNRGDETRFLRISEGSGKDSCRILHGTIRGESEEETHYLEVWRCWHRDKHVYAQSKVAAVEHRR